nr:hypothetical protein [Pediococcus acidilactici]
MTMMLFTVLSLDRLGRNSKDLTEVIDQIRRKGAVLDVLDLPTFAGVEDGNLRALLTNFGFRKYINILLKKNDVKFSVVKRQGIKIAKKKGIYKGRKKKIFHLTGSKRFLYNGVVNGLKEGKKYSPNFSRSWY